ncbi:MAG: non-hydrolyzing UDP-N-acetylglucosamine 2-epimerase [Bacteroidia bacterium]
MIHLLTVIGARPQIIKAAAFSRAIRLHFSDSIRETIVHTGQHYDENMSQVFFDELGIPAPDYNLGVGSGSHGKQTATMISGLEEILVKEKPNAIVLYGDTNSTLAGAVAASKIHIPVIHIEAGLRSFNKSMPEEINRILCDHVSSLLFSPTRVGYENLLAEGFSGSMPEKASAEKPAVYHCGDVMYDNSLHFAAVAEKKSDILVREQLKSEHYFLATVHRDGNTDVAARLAAIFDAFDAISKSTGMPVVIPLHPRTRKQLGLHPELEKRITENLLIRILPPASFLEMVLLEKHARLVITDSGGVQKEAFFFKRPCVILRPETEWVELVSCGAAILADADYEKIIQAVAHFETHVSDFPDLFGDGHASEFICREIIRHLA